MSSDNSRDSFDALRDFAGVFLQQGRAVLDSDWNEMVELFERRIRAGTVDTIGRAVVPRETMQGFEIQFSAAGGLEMGRGRMYVCGILAECHGAANFSGDNPALPNPVFDRGRVDGDGIDPEGVLNELISPAEGDFLDYVVQPYWPTPEDLPTSGVHLAYLVLWQREVTPIEAPALLEPALAGVDTTTRWQTVWQVRTHSAGPNTTCNTPDEDIPGWSEEIAPSTARLTTGTIDIEDPEDPCLVPPTEGYTGIENQLYRVELHTIGEANADGSPPTQEQAGFKYSRENRSVVSAVEVIDSTANTLTVGRVGRDEILRFRAGDWIELTDNHREFNHRSGQMLRVARVFEETRTIEFEPIALDVDLVPSGVGADTTTNRRTRLIRWDQQGVVRLADGTEWVDLDAVGSNGLIPVPLPGVVVVLESGITVEFSTAAGVGTFREMDYWRFEARTAGTQIKELRDAPPEGIQRHYCRLAVVRFGTANAAGAIADCRIFWPPVFDDGDDGVDGDGCFCTVCVNAEDHNAGTLTIQQAIDQLPDAGGTVCLEAGNYLLTEPIVINNINAFKLTGQGIGTILFYQGAGGAIQTNTAIDIQLERFSLLVQPTEDANGNMPIVHGITAEGTGLLALRRLAIVVLTANPEDRFDHGVALDGTQLGAKLEECVIIAPIALGSRSSFGLDQDGDLTFVAFAELRVLDSILFGGRLGVQFDQTAINISAALFSRNLVFSAGNGMLINWAEIPAASTSIETSTVIAERSAIIIGADTARVQDCEISGGEETGDGIRLISNLVPEARTDAQIIGNTIFDLAGAGIRIDGLHDTLLIKRNVIRRCDEAGIATTADAQIRHVAIDNNVVEEITGLNAQLGTVGILLTTAASGNIVGNSVSAVGMLGQPGMAYAGIASQGVGSVDISHNLVSQIGPDLQTDANVDGSPSFGVIVALPFLGVTVNDNRILELNENGSNNSTNWRAIQIGSTPPTDNGIGTPTNGFTALVPTQPTTGLAFIAADNRIFRASANRFSAIGLSLPSQISVKGNQMRSAQRSFGPMVSVFDPASRSLDFSQNQCDLNVDDNSSEIVVVIAVRQSIGSNTITDGGGALSMRLATGPNGAATVIGNITTGRILLNNAALPQPFDALNLQA